MRRQLILIGLGIVMAAPASLSQAEPAAALTAGEQADLQQAISAPTRTPANVARDRYRHPLETLSFFGVRKNATVVEVWPGGGWYTEILAPYLSKGGTYYAVATPKGLTGVNALAAKEPKLYGTIKTAILPASNSDEKVPNGSADVVLTFRNVHNWMMGADGYADEIFRQMYAMLKPGGVLGVVDHRLPESADPAREKASGYVKTSTVRRLAEAAGFEFVAASEINANPKDTADWPDGVWTLPPSLRKDDVDRDKYLAIGESDRMTLKFVKPRA